MSFNPEPFAVAMPYPFASRFFPTWRQRNINVNSYECHLLFTLIVSHGALSLVYSFVDDSIRNAYLPFDSLTRSMPSLVEVTSTWGLLDINSHILEYTEILEFFRNCTVDPPSRAPYSISVWLARSSAELMGATILSTVRKAARLAVYEEIRIREKNHHTPPDTH